MPKAKSTTKYDILEHDPTATTKGSITIMLAKKGTGKSYCTLNVLYKNWKKKRFNRGFLVTKTEGTDKNGFRDHIDKLYIHNNFDDDGLCYFLEQQKQMIEILRLRKEKHPKKVTWPGLEKEVIGIFEDVLDDKSVKASQFLSTVGIRGRHANFNCIIICNSPKLILPELREAADYVYIFQPTGAKAVDSLFDIYAPVDMTKEDWRFLVGSLTKDKGIMVINKPAGNVDPAKAIEWYRADNSHEKEPWVLGSDNARTFAGQYVKRTKAGDNSSCLALAKMGPAKVSESDKKRELDKKKAINSDTDNIIINDRITIIRTPKTPVQEPVKKVRTSPRLASVPEEDVDDDMELIKINRDKYKRHHHSHHSSSKRTKQSDDDIVNDKKSFGHVKLSKTSLLPAIQESPNVSKKNKDEKKHHHHREHSNHKSSKSVGTKRILE